MEITTTEIVETKRITHIKLTGKGIVTLLKAMDVVPAEVEILSVIVHVPGGGNWSNCTLDIDNHPVEVHLQTVQKVTK